MKSPALILLAAWLLLTGVAARGEEWTRYSTYLDVTAMVSDPLYEWVGTRAGLLKSQPFMSTYRQAYIPVATPLVWDAVAELLVDDDGLLWVAFTSGSLYTYDGATWEERYTSMPEPRLLLQDTLGRLWFGGRDGIRMWDGNDWSELMMPDEHRHEVAGGLRLSSGSVAVMMGTRFWDGLADEVGVYDYGKWYLYPIGETPWPTAALAEDDQGGLWAQDGAGGACFVCSDSICTYVEPPIRAAFMSSAAGDLWLGDRHGALARYRGGGVGDMVSPGHTARSHVPQPRRRGGCDAARTQ